VGNCRYAFGKEVIMSGLVRQGRFSFWDVIGEDWFVSGHFRRIRLYVETCLQDRINVGTCSARSALCRDLLDEVG